MKKIIVIEEKSYKKRKKINKMIDWLIYMVGYALILISVSILFPKTIYIDSSYFGFYGLLAAILIYVLNKTIKPIIVWLTLPITGMTLGLFYPFINVFILNIVDFILGKHFNIDGILMGVLVAIIISIMNILMDILILKPITERKDNNESDII